MARQSNVRQRILDAALVVLSRPETQMLAQPQVAKEAGIPQGHLTYYFPRKADLLAAVAECFASRILAEVQEALGPSFNPTVKADKDRAYALIERIVTDPAKGRILLRLSVAADQDEVVRKALLDGADAVRLLLGNLGGRQRDEVETVLAMATYTGLALHWLLWTDRERPLPNDVVFRTLRAAFERGIVPPED